MSDPADPLIVCPGCDRPNPGNRRSCWGCGAALGAPGPGPGSPGPGSSTGAARSGVAGGPANPPPRRASTTRAPPPRRPAPVAPWKDDAPLRRPTEPVIPFLSGPMSFNRGRRVAQVAGALVIGVVVVILLLLTLHLGAAPAASPAIAYGVPASEAQVLGPAEAAQATRTGGPWTPYGLEGWGARLSQSGTGGAIANCTNVWANSSEVHLLATPLTAAPGEFAFWVLFSLNTDGDVLITDITATNTSVVATNNLEVTGNCTSSYSGKEPLPTGLANSTTVAASANSNGGSTFLTAHPGAWELFTALGNLWTVDYTTCPLLSPSGSGELFTGEYNATTGAPVLTAVTDTVPCSSIT